MKLRMLAVTLATALVATSASAEALYVSQMDVMRMVVLNRDSIRWRDGMPTVTATTVASTPQEDENGVVAVEMERLVEYDCARPRYRLRGDSIRSVTGQLLNVSTRVSDWREIDSESVGYSERELVCFNRTETLIPISTTMREARRRYHSWVVNELSGLKRTLTIGEARKALEGN